MNPKAPGTEDKESATLRVPIADRESVPELVRTLERASMQVQSVLEEVRRGSQPPPPSSSRPPRPLWAKSDGRPLRVLVLSEDVRTRRLRVTELLAAGMEVDWARDIEEALFRATCASPDAIVLDGPRDPTLVRQLFDHFAGFEPTRGLPVILRSDFSLSPDVRERCAAVVCGPGAGEQIVGAVHALARSARSLRGQNR